MIQANATHKIIQSYIKEMYLRKIQHGIALQANLCLSKFAIILIYIKSFRPHVAYPNREYCLMG